MEQVEYADWASKWRAVSKLKPIYFQYPGTMVRTAPGRSLIDCMGGRCHWYGPSVLWCSSPGCGSDARMKRAALGGPLR